MVKTEIVKNTDGKPYVAVFIDGKEIISSTKKAVDNSEQTNYTF